MRFGISLGERDYWLKSAVVVLLMLFSQAYPHFMFQHSHDDQGDLFRLSSTAADHDSEHLPIGSEDDSHHHSLEECVDWHLSRPASSRLTLGDDLIWLYAGALADPDVSQTSIACVAEETPFPEPLPIASLTPRGPPPLG